MPQTELLIHMVLDAPIVSPAAQTEIHSASLRAVGASMGEGVTISRSSIEARPVAPVPGPPDPPEGAGEHEVA